MTTPSEAEQLIYSQWLTDWTVSGSPRTPTVFEEERAPSSVRIGEDSWVYLYVQEVDRKQLTQGKAGNRRFLQKSQVVIAIFTPQSAGTQAATDLAQAARTVFEGNTIGALRNFIGADIVRVGPKPPEFQVNVLCPFEYEEIK